MENKSQDNYKEVPNSTLSERGIIAEYCKRMGIPTENTTKKYLGNMTILPSGSKENAPDDSAATTARNMNRRKDSQS